MADDDCSKKKEDFTPTVKEGKYDSDPFVEGNSTDKGYAILSLLKKLLPKGTNVCKASCGEENRDCLPKSIDIDIPEGKGTFKRVYIETEGDESTFIYYLKMKDESKITIHVKCGCVPFPQ